jgi:hypothetical protein
MVLLANKEKYIYPVGSNSQIHLSTINLIYTEGETRRKQ